MNTVAERIILARGTTSRRAFAIEIGTTESTLRNYELGTTQPTAEFLEVLCNKLRILPEWLLLGSGPMRPDEDAPAPRQAATQGMERVVPGQQLKTVECQDCEFTLVPLAEAVLSAGNGSFEAGGAIEEHYAFRTDWVRRKGQANQMVLMRVAGDSMAPEIKNKDLVLIDQSNKRLQPSFIYAVAVEDMVYLKQANAMPGKIILTSYNEQYAPIEIDTGGDMEDSVRIIGRVVWWCREA